MRSLQVGITGGIGSGKSLVCHIFKCFGVPVYDADSKAKSLMTSDPSLVNQIKAEFGEKAYQNDGTLDRAFISKTTFDNPERLAVLNRLVHPRVAGDYQTWLSNHQDSKYVLREAALLYEVGAERSIDRMIVVSAPEELRINRVLARDKHRTRQDVQSIIKNQWPEEDKVKRADHIIYNDDEHMVIPQVLQLHELFVNLTKEVA
jgi:dephospho-CoA kinase